MLQERREGLAGNLKETKAGKGEQSEEECYGSGWLAGEPCTCFLLTQGSLAARSGLAPTYPLAPV